jgi:hypothetical protein
MKCALLLAFALYGTGSLAAQTPVELPPGEANLWQHIAGPREAIHADLSKLNPIERMNARVELEVIVSPGGRVLQAHATRGPAQFYEQAEAIERDRLFTPFTRDGRPVLAKVNDEVEIVPPETWLPNHVPFPEKVDLRTLVIALSRTRCYGRCPAYTVSLEGSGVVHFVGETYVLVPGHHTAHVSPETIQALLNAFRKANFLSAKESYSAMVTDNPSQTITLKMGETTKVVQDYVGTAVGMPDAIRALEQQIDEAAGTERWIKGNEETYKALRAEHWDFSSAGADNIALYRSAIERKDEDLVEALLRARAPVDIADEKKREDAPICVASSSGNAVLVERMFAQQSGMSKAVLQPCLAAATLSGNVELLDFWIDKGAKPEGAGSILRNGILSKNAAMVRRVLDYPVDVHEQINDIPLLSFAVERAGEGPEGPEIVGLLLKAGASPNEKDWQGRTALFSVGLQQASIQPLISLLLASGAAVDARDNNGDTALMGHAFILEMVRALLAAGADPTLADNRGQTALTMARRFACEPCATTIEEAVRKRAAATAGAGQP